ncbi:MAG TPA: YtcA family lipoprotein [Myxococcaceae bacterium]|nr:YtcA family lipoprotein [Myxococcaceae bacterium]
MHCPSLNIFGTFFPSWMLCAITGVVAAAVVHKLLGRVGARAELKAPVLVYSSLGLTVAFVVWLARYGS